MAWWFEEPWFRRFQREMERAMAKTFKEMPKFGEMKFPEIPEIAPTTDVSETDNEIIIKLDMPGIKKEDIELYATPDSVEVKAERTVLEEEKKAHFYRKERSYRAYHRVLPMPIKIDPNSIEAQYEKGILTLRAAKVEKAKKKIKIKVK